MDPFGYLSVLTSIVLALGITRILSGLGRLLQSRGRIKIYWVHLVWSLNVLIYLVMNWWILYRWHTRSEWDFFLFMFVLLSPTIGFLLSVLIYPDGITEGSDFSKQYYANHRWFFALASLLPIIDFFDTWLKGTGHLLAQGPIYLVTIGLLLVLNIIAAITPSRKYHAAFSVFFLIYLLAFISINLRVLN